MPSIRAAYTALPRVMERPECRAARRKLAELEPSWRVEGTSLRAREGERTIVAVFYQLPDLPTKPSRYRLFAVDRALQVVEELPCEPGSPYWIRGRR